MMFLAGASSVWFNLLCALAHIGSAVTILILADFGTVPIKRIALAPGADNGSLEFSLVETGDVDVASFIVAFLGITGSVHLLYAYFEQFRDMKIGFWFRYTEYAVSAPIMMVIIALLVGIREVYLLFLMATLTSVTMVYGSLQDRISVPLDDWLVKPAFLVMYPVWILCSALSAFIVTTIVEAEESGILSEYLHVTLRLPLSYLRVTVPASGGAPWDTNLQKIPGQFDVVYPLVAAVIASVASGARSWWTGSWAPRLLEATLTSSLTVFVVAALAGMREVYTLLLMVTLVPTTTSLIHIHRKLKQGDASWKVSNPHFLGYIPFLPVWAVVFSFYAISVRDNEGKPPWFVNVIIFAEFVLFSSFAAVQYMWVVRPAAGSYEPLDDNVLLSMDGAYNVLSLTSKMLLAWITFGGIMGES